VRRSSPQPENWMLVRPEETTLAQRLCDGANRSEDTRQPIAELGFMASFWNRKPDDEGGADVAATCGGWSRYTDNSFMLNLPYPEAAPQPFTATTARVLVGIVIQCWQPEWATWTSHDLADLQEDPEGPLGMVKTLGWATYFLAAPTPSSNTLPAGVKLERFESGALLTIGDDPAQVPEDLMLATRDALGEQVLGRK